MITVENFKMVYCDLSNIAKSNVLGMLLEKHISVFKCFPYFKVICQKLQGCSFLMSIDNLYID